MPWNRSRRHLILGVVLAIFALPLAQSCGSRSARKALPLEPRSGSPALNGSLELLDERGLPTGWNGFEPAAGGWSLNSESARSGALGAMLSTSGPGKPRRAALSSRLIQELEPGDAIRFELWTRTRGEPRKGISAAVEGCREGEAGSLACERIGRAWNPAGEIDGEGWQAIRGPSIVIPEGTSGIRFVVYANPAQPTGARFEFDDLTYKTASFASYLEQNRSRESLPALVLFGADALRQSVLSTYGGGAKTPRIDQLAAFGRTYFQVTSQSAWTKPSFASVFTSLYPSQHRTEAHEDELVSDHLTLAEALRRNGYFTAGFVYSRPDGFLGSERGHSQGFDLYYEDTNETRIAEAVEAFLDSNADGLADLGNGTGGGLFLFYHLMEPHTPYVNPAPDQIRNEGLLGTVNINDPDHITPIKRLKRDKRSLDFGVDFDDRDIAYIRTLYEREAELVDRRLGNVLDHFDRAGLLADSSVVLFADHGESLGERGRKHLPNGAWGHGLPYQTNLLTPMVVRSPGLVPAGEVDRTTLVSNLDILPTLLDAAGLVLPEHLEGRSLLRPAGDSLTARLGISEDRYHGFVTIRDARHKLIIRNAGTPDRKGYNLDPSQAVFEFYDLAEDPEELNDLADDQPEAMRRLLSELRKHADRVGLLAVRDQDGQALSSETVEQLRALGYMD